MSLGAAIGAITFSGSIIAFLKLRGIMSGSPITFKGQHFINLFLGLSIIALIYYLCTSQSSNIFWSIVLISFLVGVLINNTNWWSRYASCNFNVKFIFRLGCCWNWFYFENTALIITGALVGSSGAILSYIMCKGMNRSFF